MKNKEITVVIIILINLILTAFLLQAVFFPTVEQNRANFYRENVATLISPHTLRERLSKGFNDYIIVDTREREDYLAGHIIGSINIVPGQSLVADFKKLEAENPDKEILIYCYTHVCQRGKKVGDKLAQNGISVLELGIGFNEWKNFWREWNYESEWHEININDYITIGEEAGKLDVKIDLLAEEEGCSQGDYSC